MSQGWNFGIYLGSGDFTDDLSAVSGHDGLERVDDGAKVAVAAVLCHQKEQVLRQLVHAQLVASAGEPVGLDVLLDGGVEEELVQGVVLGQLGLELDEVLLDGVEGLLLGGSRVEGHGVAALGAEHGDGGLHLLEGRGGRREGAHQLRAQVPTEKHRGQWTRPRHETRESYLAAMIVVLGVLKFDLNPKTNSLAYRI